MSTSTQNTPFVSESTFSLVSTLIWTALGAGVLYFTKYVNNDESWNPAIFCVGLIMLFALVIFSIYRGAQRTRLADNCYYMGLIYTLISMVIVLVQIGEGTEESIGLGVRDDVGRVLHTFGIALTSTIAGIMARLFLQSQPESLDEGESTKNVFAESIVQPMDDAARRIRSEVEMLGGAFQNLRATMVDASEENRKAMEVQKRTFEENIGRLNDSTTNVGVSMAGLADVTNRAKSGMDAFTRVDPEKLQKVAVALESIGDVAQRTGGVIDNRMNDLLMNIDQTSAVLDRFRESYSRLKEEADKNAEILNNLQSAFTDGGKNLKLASDKYFSSMRSMSETLDVSVRRFGEAVATANEQMESLALSADNTREKLLEFSRFEPASVQEILDQYMSLATRTQEVSTSIGDGGQLLVEKFGMALSTTENLINEVKTALSTLQEANSQRERAELLGLVTDVTKELKQLREKNESEKNKIRRRRRRWWLLWLR